MKTVNFLLYFFLLLTYACKDSAKANALFIDCLNSNNIHSEEHLKNAIYSYELYLLSIGEIKDNSGESYLKLLRSLADNKITNIKEPFSKNISPFSIDFKGCGKHLNAGDNKMKQVKTLVSSLSNNKSNIHSISDKLYYILNKDDFDIVFYKLVTFTLIDYNVLKITNL
ncbi:hypothetical protein [Lacinutrix venerupis]|uniref:Lipoprotein n=1 Tax=Lacinutrix venerupis TaxID=1486034 RepID=A0AAC9LKW9_9FLAO|nr:hypothetical protein [Lacinutrix venerupis]APY00334.1 hypothetical protein BWR22_08400 [Lacinutrix venerupis]